MHHMMNHAPQQTSMVHIPCICLLSSYLANATACVPEGVAPPRSFDARPANARIVKCIACESWRRHQC
ncbi:hypothetical protein CDEST_10923 [Colletotrichum destructivum]|uniref:Secreted protein n=1 Tax=Colletotrichum destructivum TaxID=34406 RepID=A0AAX4IRM7_9PEZI|nr:hypothetical protein CDEST_10923 [Colletotrichum destructivum]